MTAAEWNGDAFLAEGLIDVWNVKTFDSALLLRLAPYIGLVVDYFRTDHQIFMAHDLGRGNGRSRLRPDNPHARAFQAFRGGADRRHGGACNPGWHYTGMTDAEINVLRRDGPHLSTPATLRRRLNALVAAGNLSTSQADTLYAASPFHTSQRASRQGKFWMVSHPIAIDDGGVEPVMAHWGGEVASMFMKEEALLAPLANIGRPRIIELAVPLAATNNAYSAVEAVVATLAGAHGAFPDTHAFHPYAHTLLGGAAIRNVHTEGEASFAVMGRGHPAGFVDVFINR